MKRKLKNKIIFTMLFFLMAGCGHEYDVRTIIYKDGSCKRILTVSGDSIASFFTRTYPVPIDQTWDLVSNKEITNEEDTLFVYTASKLYPSIDSLNVLYQADTTYMKYIKREINLKKKFRWFYTYYDYSETYHKLFNQPSLSKYMDSTQLHFSLLKDEEQDEYLKENFDSVEAVAFEDRVDLQASKWMAYTLVSSGFEAIEEGVRKNEFLFDTSKIKRMKETLLKMSLSDSVELWEMFPDLDELVKVKLELDSVTYEKLSDTKSFSEHLKRSDTFNQLLLGNEYTNHIQLPGLVIETNANYKEEESYGWNIKWLKYFTDDYEMNIHSRIINKWAFWVSGGIILVFLVLVILMKKK